MREIETGICRDALRAFSRLDQQILPADSGATPTSDDGAFERRRFADAESALLAFVQKYGFLGSQEWGDEGEKDSFERIEYLWAQHKHLSAFLEFGADAGTNRAEIFGREATVKLIEDANTYRIHIEPKTFIDCMWLTLAQDLSVGARYGGPKCAWCDKPMLRGGLDGYRIDAIACTDTCRRNLNRRPIAEIRKRLSDAGWSNIEIRKIMARKQS